VSTIDLELTRSASDRRVYVIDGVGVLRLHGPFSGGATAEAAASAWRFTRTGLWRRVVQAVDASGHAAGEFVPRGLRRGGAVRWAGRELTLSPASSWRERYALHDAERELAVLDGRSWGKRPVTMSVDPAVLLEPGLLLFAAFVVRGLAKDADNTAAGGAASTAATGC
jgi:hypothetical protein